MMPRMAGRGEGDEGQVCVVGLISSVWRAGSSSQSHCLNLPMGRPWPMELDELESQD